MKLIFEHLASQLVQANDYDDDNQERQPNKTRYTHTPASSIYVAHKEDFVQQQHGVGFSVIDDNFFDDATFNAINMALSSIFLSLDSHSYNPKVIQTLWQIVKQSNDGDSFYDDCKNYIININSQQSVFLVRADFDSPASVKLNALCTQLFLWAYLTLLESPTTNTQLHIELPNHGFSILTGE